MQIRRVTLLQREVTRRNFLHTLRVCHALYCQLVPRLYSTEVASSLCGSGFRYCSIGYLTLDIKCVDRMN